MTITQILKQALQNIDQNQIEITKTSDLIKMYNDPNFNKMFGEHINELSRRNQVSQSEVKQCLELLGID